MNTLQRLIVLASLAIPKCLVAQNNCTPEIRTAESITLCQGDTMQYGEKIITSSGIYIQKFITQNGCDSTVRLGVTYLNNSNFSFTASITTNESYFFNNQNLTQAGIYRDTFQDQNGCDSVLTLTLEVLEEKENCDNGIDDDGDGLVDIFDNDCLCLLSKDPKNLVPNGNFEEKVGCCRGLSKGEEMCVDNWVNLSGTSFIYHHPECWAVLGQPLPKEGVTLESGFVAGRISYWEGFSDLNSFSLGICLDEPMYAGNTYELTFDMGSVFQSSPFIGSTEMMHFLVNGITDCEQLSNYIFDEDFCKKDLPYETLARINLSTLDSGWNQFSFTIIPTTTVEAIFLSGDCGDELVGNSAYHVFYDNISIVSENGLRLKNEIQKTGNDCGGETTLSIPNTKNFEVTWYKDSSILVASPDNNLRITDNQGMYHAKVTFEDGRCQLIGGTTVAPKNLTFQLPNDTLLCAGENLTLQLDSIGDTHRWQDGSTQPTYTITQSGIYWAEISQGDCKTRDSIVVTYNPAIDFLPDNISVCNQNSQVIFPKSTYKNVLWWENDTVADSLLVNETGLYHAFLVENGCEWEDSIQVTFNQVAVTLPPDTTLCEGETLLLNIDDTDVMITWQDNSSDNQFLIENGGTYWVQLAKNNCSAEDTLTVTYENCNPTTFCEAYLPNAFSPNNDGNNDHLQLLTDCEIQQFEMEIYDRWGNLLFVTETLDNGWDGTYQGKLMDAGVYMTKLRYRFMEQGNEKVRFEAVTLVR